MQRCGHAISIIQWLGIVNSEQMHWQVMTPSQCAATLRSLELEVLSSGEGNSSPSGLPYSFVFRWPSWTKLAAVASDSIRQHLFECSFPSDAPFYSDCSGWQSPLQQSCSQLAIGSTTGGRDLAQSSRGEAGTCMCRHAPSLCHIWLYR